MPLYISLSLSCLTIIRYTVLTQNSTASKNVDHISFVSDPSPHRNNSYIIRIYHQGTKEIVIDVDPPVSVYNAFYPDFAFRTIMGLCWWSIREKYSFFVKYEGQLVCRWGGESVVQQLPYECGPRARGL